MKKFGIVLLCLIVGGIFCIGSIKLLDGVPEFCLAVLSVEIFCLIMMKLYKPEKTKGEIFIEEAKAAGRVVTAHLVKKKYIHQNSNSKSAARRRRSYYVGKYKYEINGRKYRCSRSFYSGYPSDEITLYYAKRKPKDAIYSAVDIDEDRQIANFFLILVLAFVLYGILKLIIDVDMTQFIRENLL